MSAVMMSTARPSLAPARRARAARATRARAPRAAVRNARVAATAEAPSAWYKGNDPFVWIAGYLGWTVPSCVGTPAFDGESLFGRMVRTTFEELAHYPTGPALDSDFWLPTIAWHLGLFLTITLGVIGVQGKKQGYW